MLALTSFNNIRKFQVSREAHAILRPTRILRPTTKGRSKPTEMATLKPRQPRTRVLTLLVSSHIRIRRSGTAMSAYLGKLSISSCVKNGYVETQREENLDIWMEHVKI